jgi:YaiO family outer membrane protein
MNRLILALLHAGLLAGAALVHAQDSPPSFDQQFQTARDLAIAGQRDAAVAAYTGLLQRSPGNADVLLGRGRLYSWMGKWAEAEADLSAATVAAPNYADSWSALGDLYLWSDRPRQAAEAYSRWLALAPALDPAPLIARGRAFRAAGELAAARADFQAAGARAADPVQIDEYLRSLTPRALSPDVSVPAGYAWSASLGASWESFSPARADWSDYTLSVRRHFERGSLALETLGANRFSSSANAWALDGYVDVWSRAYANLRYQRGASGSLFPQTSWRAELYQGVGRRWELAGSYDRLDFTSSGVGIYGLGVGKYVGNWYLRLRHLFVPGSGGNSNSDRLLARYYYKGDADNYVECAAGAGWSDTVLPGTPGTPGSSGQGHSWSTSAALVMFTSPRLGFKLGAVIERDEFGYDGRGVFGSVYTRW